MMTFRVVSKPSYNHVRCPYRLIEQSTGRERVEHRPILPDREGAAGSGMRCMIMQRPV